MEAPVVFKVQAFGDKEADLIRKIGEALGYEHQGTEGWDVWFRIVPEGSLYEALRS